MSSFNNGGNGKNSWMVGESIKGEDLFEEFVRNLDHKELQSVEQLFSSGNAHNILGKHKRRLSNPMLVCPVCESGVCEQEDLLLEFGPRGLRQKARFCGHDCLEFFLSQRKSLKQKNILEEEHATQ